MVDEIETGYLDEDADAEIYVWISRERGWRKGQTVVNKGDAKPPVKESFLPL